jgi:2,3-bisphosphoglycerate-independent phosphoglycerate mutase
LTDREWDPRLSGTPRFALNPGRKYVLFIPDGAADQHRLDGRSPLAAARLENCDAIARAGVMGRMQTLYPHLPKESMVAQLGILGWDPRIYYPNGRSSCELLALDNSYLGERDLAFRANLVSFSAPSAFPRAP